jgi:hypothetical protein
MSSQPSQPRYRIVLEKEDFKFSAAHFTLFADGGAELLHGHRRSSASVARTSTAGRSCRRPATA